MKVKRRSNWYIYLITFVATGFILGIVVLALSSHIFPSKDGNNNMFASNTNNNIFIPDSSHNFTLLFILSEEAGGSPEYFMTVSYLPADSTITCIPFRKNMKAVLSAGESTLQKIYDLQGGIGVINSIKQETGLTIDRYVKFDRDTFISFIDLIGNVKINIPNDLTYENKKTNTVTTFKAGIQTFSGINLYNYITFPDFDKDADYKDTIQVTSISSFINQNLRYTTKDQLDRYFDFIVNTSETNITLEDCNKKKEAILYTVSVASEPTVYYTPYGSTADGMFSISEASKNSILDRVGQANLS